MARHKLSVSEKVWIVKNMYRLAYPIQVQRLWHNEMENEPPSRKTINTIMNNFGQNGSILKAPPSGRPVSVTGESIEDEVSSILVTEHQTSTRRMSTLLNIPRTSIRGV